VTEIPDHLLQRTRSRRQALGLPVSGGGDAGEASGAPAAGSGVAVPSAAPAAELPKGPVAPSTPVETTKPAPKPAPHYVQAYQRRKKIPIWAMPAVLALPLWAVLYAGTLTDPPTNELTLLAEGAEVFAGNCSSCHGAGGGGGVGPALADGAVLETFPDPVDHVKWVITGSEGAEGGVYGAPAKPSVGGMPSFGGSLSFEEIVAVVLDEREAISGEEIEDVAEQWADLGRLVEDPAVVDAGAVITDAEVEEVLVRLSEESGVEIGTGEE
jgi:mono/diheme cytochrome c family protein